MQNDNLTPNISSVDIKDALSERYLSYAVSTIVSRSLPDVRDGLKPVHRRLIFAMQQLGVTANSPYKKSARIVGDVMGKYHPHGNIAIYDTLVRLAQDFSLRYPLVDGQGNFGNIDGDNAAADRYTEARLTFLSEWLLEELEYDTVEFLSTYDGEGKEPTLLPAQFPQLLANGALGIAVGMATNIPPHNLTEIFSCLLHLIDTPNMTTEEICTYIKAPDFPTGGVIIDSPRDRIESYATGKGSFRIRARYNVEYVKKEEYQIIITEIPYQVTKSKIIERLHVLLEEKNFPLLADVRDESAEDIRLVLIPKSSSVKPDQLMKLLFKATELETRFHLNMNVLDVDQTPRVLSLKSMLQRFLDFRFEVIRKSSAYHIQKIEARLDTLKALFCILDDIDALIKAIRYEDNPKTWIMNKWGLSDIQTESILNLRLRALQKLEEIKIRKEYDSLSKKLLHHQTLISSKQETWKAVKKQICDKQKILEQHPLLCKRRTFIESIQDEEIVSLEQFIQKEPLTILLTQKGWIKAVKGHNIDATSLKVKEKDSVQWQIESSTTDKIILATTGGKFYTLAGHQLPEGKKGEGTPITAFIDMDPNDRILEVLSTESLKTNFLMVCSQDGKGFKVLVENIFAQTRLGKKIMPVKTPIEMCFCQPLTTKSYVAFVGENRRLLIIKEEDIPTMQKGRGVQLQKYQGSNLSDISIFTEEEGLFWQTKSRCKKVKDWTHWVGQRGARGRLCPNGFPKNNKFFYIEKDAKEE